MYKQKDLLFKIRDEESKNLGFADWFGIENSDLESFEKTEQQLDVMKSVFKRLCGESKPEPLIKEGQWTMERSRIGAEPIFIFRSGEAVLISKRTSFEKAESILQKLNS